MFISGEWKDENDKLLEEVFGACYKIENELRRGKGKEGEAATQLYSDISAVTAGIWKYCKQDDPRRSAQLIALMLRTLLDGCISAYALSRDLQARAGDYVDFRYVVQFQLACNQEEVIGSPFVGKWKLKSIQDMKTHATDFLRKNGARFLKKTKKGAGNRPGKDRSKKQLLEEALMPGREKPKRFRQTWFPGTRREVLERENMEWLYDFFWPRLSSATHTDSCASLILGNASRGHLAILALQFWCAAVYRIVEALGITLPAPAKGGLRKCYTSLQWNSRDNET